MIYKIDAEQRKTVRKSDLTNLRNSGLIPAIVYGPGTEPIQISLNKAEFMKSYKKSFGELSFFEIQLNGANYHTLIKERQIHPVSREILHVDFMVVPPHHLIEVEVPLKFIGTPVGVKAGGMLDIVQRMLKISCTEEDIPEDIEVDISSLEVGGSFHVRQLPVGKWHVKDHADNALAVVHAKRVEAKTTDTPKEA
jgi:large subunit ribosomal protein L25